MRSAIYFAPPAGSALETFGCGWLGRTLDGKQLAPPTVAGIAADRLVDITRSPRHYGFHGTLKAPFSLTEEASSEDLGRAVARFARERTPFEISIRVDSLGGFLAFVPAAPASELNDLAARCVETFEPFRAPLDEAELARRRAANLSERQDRYLQRYGYPYVMDEFRFHMTLTERLQPPERDRVLSLLTEQAAAICAEPLVIGEIAVFDQPNRESPFVLRQRYPFGRS